MLSKYKVELFIVFLHFTPIHILGILVGFFYTFWKIAFVKKIDLLAIFILLIPSIAIRKVGGVVMGDELGGGGLLSLLTTYFEYAIAIGPLMLSTKLGAAFGVPIRLLMTLGGQKNRILLTIWYITLFISLAGLYISYTSGLKSAGGLTVGFRGVLSMGALLIPLAINRDMLSKNLDTIIKISVFMLFMGLMNEHWAFVATSLATLVVFYNRKLYWKFYALIWVVPIAIFGLGTFTYIMIVIFTVVLLALNNSITRTIVFSRAGLLTIVSFPVLMVILVLGNAFFNVISAFGTDEFLMKLYTDRGILWSWTSFLVINSNFFIVPSGRSILVLDYGAYGEVLWEPGAHNIYLELARQIGLFSAIILFIIVLVFVVKNRDVFISRYRNLESKVLICLLTTYMVFGLTGNSLVYDGVGFMFWLMFGQIIKSMSAAKKA